MNASNRAHASVIQCLAKHGIVHGGDKPLRSPLQGATDGAKDKDKDKEGGPGEIKPENPRTFKQWTTEEFTADCQAANVPEILTPAELQDFVGYWLLQTASGRPQFKKQDTWDGRRRMHTALERVYLHKRTAAPGIKPATADKNYTEGWGDGRKV